MSGPARLISTPEAPAPAGAEAAWVEGCGGLSLRTALFPAGRPRGSVVLSPGRTEFIEKYYEVIAELTGRGFTVLAHDWRGQGLSQRLLPDVLAGHAEGYDAFIEDHRRVLDAYADRLPRPWIALGHSMGGALALLALVEGEDRFAAAALTSPMLGVQFGGAPRALARTIAWLMTRCGRGPSPIGRANSAAFEGNVLTHDRARYRRAAEILAAAPELGLGAPTWGWIDFALKAERALARPGALERVSIPVLLFEAGRERLVLNALIRRAAARLPCGRLVTAPDASHEILMETDEIRAVFWTAFDELAAAKAPSA